MRQPRLQAPPVRTDLDQPERLHLLDRLGVGQPGEHPHADRLGEGQHLHDRALGVREPPDPRRDELGQPRRQLRTARPAPPTAGRGQPARLHLPLDQVTQIQRVTPGDPPQVMRGRAAHRATERGPEQTSGLRLGQRGQIQPLQVLVLPQPGDRLGRRFPAADRENDARITAQNQMLHQRRGQVVEQVRIVHHHDEKPFRLHPREQGRPGTVQQRRRVLARTERTQTGRESRERQRPRRGRAHHPTDRRAPPLRPLCDNPGQQRLPHPRRPGEHQPATPTRADPRADRPTPAPRPGPPTATPRPRRHPPRRSVTPTS